MFNEMIREIRGKARQAALLLYKPAGPCIVQHSKRVVLHTGPPRLLLTDGLAPESITLCRPTGLHGEFAKLAGCVGQAFRLNCSGCG